MKINSLYLENFKIFGPEGVEIHFDSVSELMLCLGPNGNGKSSISTGIIYALYGKNPDGNITDLPNWMNSDNMLVKIDITAKGSNIIIERGRNGFNITIDGQDWEQAGKSNMQDFLEREYFDLPYYTFKNLLVLSINDFKSFLTMSPSDKRKIIDKIFGFSIINEMKELNKDYLKSVKSEIENFEIKINQLEKSINETKTLLNEIRSDLKKKNSNKSELLESKINKKKESIEQIKVKLSKIKEQRNKLSSELNKRKKRLSNLKYKLKTILEKKKLYNNKKCPTCNSDLETKYHKKLLEEYKEEENTLENKINEIEKEIDNFNKKSNKISKKISKFDSHLSKINSQFFSLKEQFKGLNKQKDQEKIKEFKSLIDNFEDDKKNNKKISKKKKKQKRFYSIVNDLLSENGIKSIAIKTIIPNLNNLIQEEIKNMHLKYNAYFDENFDIVLTYFGEEISAKVLSTGEKKKYDFVILIGILKLIKAKYQSLNLLFLDEIFSSIDADGRHSILQILRNFIDNYDMSAIVINHAELPLQFFDKKLKLENDSTYSSLEVENL